MLSCTQVAHGVYCAGRPSGLFQVNILQLPRARPIESGLQYVWIQIVSFAHTGLKIFFAVVTWIFILQKCIVPWRTNVDLFVEIHAYSCCHSGYNNCNFPLIYNLSAKIFCTITIQRTIILPSVGHGIQSNHRKPYFVMHALQAVHIS